MGLPIKITDAGKQAIINAQNTGTGAVLLSQMALGTGNFDPTAAAAASMTHLVSEFKRVNLAGGSVVAADTIHVVVEDTSADAYTVNEFGIYTDGGVLFAVYSQTSGNITAKAAGAIMLLVSDILLTDVSANSVTFGNLEFVNPPASETVQGVAKVATQALVDTGTDDTTFLTPKKAKARYADLRGAGFTGRVQINGAADDGSTALAVNGSISSKAGSNRFNLLSTNNGQNVGYHTLANDVNGVQRVAGYYFNPGTSIASSYLTLSADDNTSHLNIFGNGHVTIGTVTDNGTDALQVAGNVLTNTLKTAQDAGVYSLNIGRYNSTLAGAFIKIVDTTGGTNHPTFLAFHNSGGTDLLKIMAAGRVLVNGATDNGTDALQVAGNGLFTGIGKFGPSTGYQIQIQKVTNSIDAYNNGIGSTLWLQQNTSKNVVIGNVADNGTDALQVAGSGLFTGQLKANSTGANIRLKSDGTTGKDGAIFADANGNIGIQHWVDALGGALVISPSGRLLIKTAADNGTDALQVAGSILSTGKLFASATGATNASGYGNTNQLSAPVGTVALFIGNGNDTSGLTASQYSNAIRFNGAGCYWGDISYYPKAALSGGGPAFKFTAAGATVEGGASASVGMGTLYSTKVLVNGAADNGSDALQVNGGINAGSNRVVANAFQINALQAAPSNAVTWQIFGNSATSTMDFVSGGIRLIPTSGSSYLGPFAVFQSNGRALFNGATDNGTDVIQANGDITATGKVKENGNPIAPAGKITYFAQSTAPAGYLKCNGAAISRTTYASLFSAIGTTFGTGDGSTTFNVPDLRGEFIRGFDDGRGVDSGRAFGSWQGDQLGSHTHPYTGMQITGTWAQGGSRDSISQVGATTGATGGNETRPRNVALLACIKY